MKLTHPHTGQAIAVPDETANQWLEAGWLADPTPPTSPNGPGDPPKAENTISGKPSATSKKETQHV